MAKISKEFKIGIAFIFAIFLLYYGISFLRGVNIFKPSNSYVVVFDNVAGLTMSAPVTVNGLQVGLVRSMEIDPNNSNRIATYIDMDKGIKVPKGSRFELESSLLGNANLILKMGSPADGYLSVKDTIFGSKKSGLMDAADKLGPQLGDMMPKIDSILTSIEALAGNPALSNTLNNLDQTMANVNNITSDLAQATKQLSTTMTAINRDVPTITSDLAATTKKLNDMDLASTYQSIDATLKNIENLSSKLNSKDNSIGLLLNDRQLYDSINSTLNNASLLLKDVKENPKKYINVKVF